MYSLARRITFGLQALLAVVTALLATGCGPGLSPNRPLAVRVVVPPDVEVLPLYLGIERGYFAAEGLAVTVVPDADQYRGLHTLADGGAEIAFGASSIVVESAKHGHDMRILAEAAWLGGRTAAIVVRGDGSVLDLAALAGRWIAAPSPGSQDRLLARARLDNDSAAAASNRVQWERTTAPEHRASQLANRDVDAAVLREPWLTDAIRAHGFTALAYLGTTNILFPTSTYVATSRWTDKHPDAVAAFQRALHRAAGASARPALDDLAVRHLHITPHTAARMDLPLYPTIGPSAAQLQRVPNLMHHYGILTGPFRVAPLVALSGE